IASGKIKKSGSLIQSLQDVPRTLSIFIWCVRHEDQSEILNEKILLSTTTFYVYFYLHTTLLNFLKSYTKTY
ncbi:hypothetical protein ACJX0J_039820, partial [Zea mays]